MTFAIIIAIIAIPLLFVIARRITRRMRQIGRILDKEAPDD